MIASDPDADRIGVGIPVTGDPRGEWTTLDGNQIGVLLAAFVMKESEALGRLRSDHYIVTTIVSTQMTRALAQREGIRTEDDLLVGFKWIANRIEEAGPASFLFAFEESHGYLKGMDVRDKDASVAALLFAELAATVKDRKQTVLEYLDDLYIDVGHYAERLVTKTCEGREGHAQIKRIMEAFRSRPPREIGGLTLTEVLDYQRHEVRPLSQPGPPTPLPQPSGDLLIFHTDRTACRFAARPSGTEPKIKFYFFARSGVDGPDSLPAAKDQTRQPPRPDGRRPGAVHRRGAEIVLVTPSRMRAFFTRAASEARRDRACRPMVSFRFCPLSSRPTYPPSERIAFANRPVYPSYP